MKRLLVGVLLATALIGCQQAEKSETVAPTSGIDLTNMDTTVRPQDNMYNYVNGTWMKNAEIPGDKTATGSFYDLRDKARDDVKSIIDDVTTAKDLKANSEERKVADLYNSFMDVEHLNKLGLKPLEERLALIDNISSKQDMSRYFGQTMATGGSSPIALYIGIDDKDATKYTVFGWQSGLGLPDRDYYFNEDQRFVDFRSAYVEHVKKMFELANFDSPQASADKIMALETKLADKHWTNVECRDSEALYNQYQVADLNQLGDKIDWPALLKAYGADSEKVVVINQPSFVTGLNEAINSTSLADWKIYLKWDLLNNAAGMLSAEFDHQNFEFYSRTLSGQEEQRDRWKRATGLVSGVLGEAIGKIYVSRYFKPEAKERMNILVANLSKAYGVSIDELEWMGAETKKAAKVKLNKFTPKVGYTDKWEDYSKLEIVAGDLLGSLANAAKFEHALEISKLGGPIRKWEWGMTPQTVNAYYSPSSNEIVFPAAILQPPFFNMAADDAVNYGAIGAVIGHEMGHGFDDQGSRYDGDGNMRNWWTEQDQAEFEKRTKQLIAQYDGYFVFDDLHINGDLTLGENIGDLSGLTIAYRAYKMSLDGKEAPVIDGFTGDQRFFMGWAQVWRSKYTEKAMRSRVATDPHSPAEFRALGSLSNSPEFYAAFDIKEGDGMYLPAADRVKIW